MTKTSGCPGIERSGSTSDPPGPVERQRRATSPGARRRRPAAHRTVRAPMRSAPRETPSASTPVTGLPVRTSTPRARSCLRRALGALSACRRRGCAAPPRRGRSRASRGSIARKSLTRTCREISRDRPGELDAGRASAHDDEREELAAARRVRLALGLLEREQDAPADRERVLERLETGRVLLPFVVAEVGVAGSGREDEVVVARGFRRQGRPPRRAGVDRDDVGEQDARRWSGAAGSERIG